MGTTPHPVLEPPRGLSATGTVLDGIGGTPLVKVSGVWAKLEYLNPSGSIKARVAAYIVDRAEREGLLRPGDTIVEASSGNTGNALAMVAAVKGYRMVVVMPRGMSRERLAISKAFDAEVELSRRRESFASADGLGGASAPTPGSRATSTSTRHWPGQPSWEGSRAGSPRPSSPRSGTSRRTAPGSVPSSSTSCHPATCLTHW